MQINLEKQLISMTEANQNFSKVARMVDETGTAVVLKNNQPKYVIMDYQAFSKYQALEDEKLDAIAQKIIRQYINAFKELAE